MVPPWSLLLGIAAYALRGLSLAPAPPSTLPAHERPLKLAAGVACVFSLGAILLTIAQSPMGGWDAWAIWNLKARFLYFGLADGSWSQLFRVEIGTHPDYPLLLPATIARYWLSLGEASQWAPGLIGFACVLLCVMFLIGAGRTRADSSIVYAGVLVFLSSTAVTQQAGIQFADLPLALYFLAAVVMLDALWTRQVHGSVVIKEAILLGLLLGLATEIKNEGILISLLVFGVFSVRQLATGQYGYLVRTSTVAVIFWCVAHLPHRLFMFQHPVTNDLVASASAGAFLDMLTPERLVRLFEAVLPHLLDFIAAPLVLFAAFLLLFRPKHLHNTAWWLLVIPLLLYAGYLAVLFFTPHDLNWHVDTTWQRLMLHGWPALMYSVMVLVGGADTTRKRLPVHEVGD